MNRKARSLQLANESFTAFKFVVPLAKFLNENGIIAEIGCSDKEYADAKSFIQDIRQSGLRWWNISIEREISPFCDLKSFFKLIKLFRKEKFDIVHTQTSKAGIIGRIAAKMAGVPIVVHYTYDYAFTESTNIWKKMLFIIAEKIAASCSDRIYFISKAEMERCFKYNITDAKKTMHTGPVGLNLEEFSLDRITEENKQRVREKYGLCQCNMIVGTVTRLVPHKGVDVFIKAALRVIRLYPDCKFVVVGGGPLLQQLKSLAVGLGIADNTIFTGFITEQSEIPVIMSLFDIFCLPTKKEGFGIVFAEAGALLKPVVGSDIPPVNYIIEDEITGLLASPDDVEMFAKLICRLIGNENLRRDMGLAGRRRAETVFDGKIAYERIREDYLKLMEGKCLG